MSEFTEQFRAYALEQRSQDEDIQRIVTQTKKTRFEALQRTEHRKMQLQLVAAHIMREDAKSIVDLIPEDIAPTDLIISDSYFIEPDDDGTVKERQLYNRGGMPVETKVLGRVAAWMVSPRYQRTVEDEAQTMIFAPIFVATDGELWIAPKHELRNYEDYTDMTVQEEIGRKTAFYRKAMRGKELQGRPKRYNTRVESNSPRLANDEDLVPVERLSVLQLVADFTAGEVPEVVIDWRNDLLTMVKPS